MGLFISEEKHQGIYKNKDELKASNQFVYQRSHLADILAEQQKQHHQLNQSINELKALSLKLDVQQMSKWQAVSDHLTRIEDKGLKQEKLEHHLTNQIGRLIEENQALQMSTNQNQVNHQAIEEQMAEMNASNESIRETITEQKEVQQSVLKRIENQEALTEKALRQLNHLRSILYERTGFVTEKIEESFKQTSTHLYQLMTGNEQLLTVYMPEKKKE